MQPKISPVLCFIRSNWRTSPAIRDNGRRRTVARPRLELLERRLNLSTYIWTALGDGQTWNDANNWQLLGAPPFIQPPTVPTANSNVVFPPIASLPPGSSSTINFNFAFLNMPVNSLTIEDSYTFTGNPIKIDSSLSVASPFTNAPNGATATFLLAGLQLGPGVVISAGTGATLQLANASDPTGLLVTVQGPVTKSGGGQLVVDTQSVFFANSSTVQPIPVTVLGGSIVLGASVNLGGLSFQINSTGGLLIADNVAAKVQALTGTGLVDLEGTTVAGDLTSLTVAVPNDTTDQFNGFIDGMGQFIAGGNGTLTTGAIDFGGTGSIQVLSGTLDVDGTISAGTLQVSAIGTFGGLGMWNFSGAVVFQSGSTFDVTLDGTSPGTQYTQLVDNNATSGLNLGLSTLAASVGYEYEQGDQYTIISSPLIQNVFQNVVAGRVFVDGTIPMGVSSTSTTITLTPLQSETTTGLQSSTNRSNPGLPVTFTAVVSTRTAPVAAGTVSFVQGPIDLATVALGGGGAASFTTTSLPLGSTAITAVYSQTKYILVATVTADGDPALTPTGTVVFRRNGRSLGSAGLKGGVARLVLGRKAPGSQAKFVASFQKNTRFRSSSSPPFEFVS